MCNIGPSEKTGPVYSLTFELKCPRPSLEPEPKTNYSDVKAGIKASQGRRLKAARRGLHMFRRHLHDNRHYFWILNFGLR